MHLLHQAAQPEAPIALAHCGHQRPTPHAVELPDQGALAVFQRRGVGRDDAGLTEAHALPISAALIGAGRFRETLSNKLGGFFSFKMLCFVPNLLYSFPLIRRENYMSDNIQDFQANYIELTADIVAAYVSNNSVPVTALADLLSNVHAAISGLTAGGESASAPDKVEKPTPAQIKKSITPDALISFEDGKSYKTLRRHLTLRGLSPEAYRAKHGLPADYPMTAASYSAQRSALARSLGLGQIRQKTAQEADAVPAKAAAEEAVPASEKPKKVGRPLKATAAK